MAFCKEFNAVNSETSRRYFGRCNHVFKDKSFTFITRVRLAAILLKKAANIAAVSEEPNKTSGQVHGKQVMEIVRTKRKRSDIPGTRGWVPHYRWDRRQMGLEIVD